MRRPLVLIATATMLGACAGTASDLGDGPSDESPGAPQAKPQPPSAPTELAAAATSAFEVQLTWKDNATNEEKFQVERAADAAGPWTKVASPTADATMLVEMGLAEKTTYFYRVIAWNPVGASPESNVASATTPMYVDTSLPQKVTGVTATALGNSSIELTWAAALPGSTGDVVGYRIFLNNLQIASTTTDLKYTDRNLASKVMYCYRVRAVNSKGKVGDESEMACATTQ